MDTPAENSFCCRPFASLLIAAYLALQAWFILSCYFRDEKFFGWQMFSGQTVTRTYFYGVDRQGIKTALPESAYRPFFQGWAGEFFVPEDRARLFGRGEKFFLKEFERIPAFLCEANKDAGYVAIEVSVEYRDIGAETMNFKSFRKVCAE